MNKELQTFWWDEFCNRCKNEDCKHCDEPELDPLFHDMVISMPSNFVPIKDF